MKKSMAMFLNLNCAACHHNDNNESPCEFSTFYRCVEKKVLAQAKEIADLKAQLAEKDRLAALTLQDIVKDQDSLKSAREALVKYGRHTKECASEKPIVGGVGCECDCGFGNAVLATQEGRET